MCSVGNTTAGVEVEFLSLGLSRSTAVVVGAAFGMAVDGIDQALIDEILRGELEALGVGVFPGGRAQIAGGHLALAAVEFGDLAELQRIAVASIAVEIVQNAAADAGDLRIAAGAPRERS